MADINSRDVFLNHTREISKGSEKRFLNIAERIMNDMAHPPNKRSPGIRGWRDKKGLFHTCEITFFITHEYHHGIHRVFINIRYCKHLEKIFMGFVAGLVNAGILKS